VNRKVTFYFTILCLICAVLVSVQYMNHESAHATHTIRGCGEYPAIMETPHWVQDYLCRPGEQYATTAITMGTRDGKVIRFVAFFEDEEGVGDPDKWVATALFEMADGRYGRLLVFGTADGKKYVANRVPERLAL